jgi:hypothetical protein
LGRTPGREPAGLDVAVMSTLNPAAMAKLAEQAAAHGLTLVDAPVSGGGRRRGGALAIMLAGEPAAPIGCARSSSYWARTASWWASEREWAKRCRQSGHARRRAARCDRG